MVGEIVAVRDLAKHRLDELAFFFSGWEGGGHWKF
jgi:hypothetical protein